MSEALEPAGGAPEPRANPELLAHAAAERTLLDACGSGRLPHGWLIAGPRGVGKATLAFRFARFVLAGGGAPGLFGDGPDSLSVDPSDPVFQRVAASAHGDLMTLEREPAKEGEAPRGVIVVDQVRKAGNFLALTASEGGWRVVVVDAAEDLNANAANALLKILEEPPDNTLILLVCHAPGRIPATIRSRCCRLNLKRLADETVATLLHRCRPELSDGDAAALALLGEGSIGRALALADQGGLELYRLMMGLIAPLPETDRAAVHELGERLSRRGAEDSYRTVTGLLTWWLARLVRAGAAGAAPEIVDGEGACMARLLDHAGLAEWAAVWEKITRLIDQADRVNLDRKQVVLSAFHAMEQAARA